MWKEWVLDASMGWPPVFCPVEGDLASGDFSIVTGMNLIGSPPREGRVVAVIHPDGQDAADTFYAEHQKEIDEILAEARGK